MITNYGNCSNFKICNENDEFLKYNNNQTEEKDYRQAMLMSTPPSNLYKNSKYVIGNSTHNNIALFTCTPKEEANKVNKEDGIKLANTFNQVQINN